MASRRFDFFKTLGLQRCHVGGRFLTNGGSNPTTQFGKGWTVARTGVGLYLVTFADNYNNYDEVLTGVQAVSTASQATAQPGTLTLGSGGTATTLVIAVYVGGVLTDMAANANNSVNFYVRFKNTSVSF